MYIDDITFEEEHYGGEPFGEKTFKKQEFIDEFLAGIPLDKVRESLMKDYPEEFL